MQRWMTAAIAAAALAATTGLAQAHDSHSNWRGHDDQRGSRNWQPAHSDARGRGWHPEPQRDTRYGYSRYEYSSHGRPAWQASAYQPSGYHPWVRGGYLPRAYFGPRYVVRDYGYYGLRAPPYGYGWVRVNNDFLLAALATGFVADALFGGY